MKGGMIIKFHNELALIHPRHVTSETELNLHAEYSAALISFRKSNLMEKVAEFHFCMYKPQIENYYVGNCRVY
jgi:hypothetical protein